MNPRLRTLPDLVFTMEASERCRRVTMSIPSLAVWLEARSFILGSKDVSLDTGIEYRGCGCTRGIEESEYWNWTGTLGGRRGTLFGEEESAIIY